MPLNDQQRRVIAEYVLAGSPARGLFEDTPLGEAYENDEVSFADIDGYVQSILDRELDRLTAGERPAALEQDPETISDPQKRAQLVFAQWHIDEVTTEDEATVYADRLLQRLARYGLQLSVQGGLYKQQGWVIQHGERYTAATDSGFEWTDELAAAIWCVDRASAEQLAAILGDDATAVVERELVRSPSHIDPDFPPT